MPEQEEEKKQGQEQEQDQDSSGREGRLPGPGEFPSEEEIDSEIETVGEESSISPFDPDFLIFALPFAFITDLILGIVEIVALFTGVAKIVAIVINVIALIIFGAWMLWRFKRIVNNKKDYVKSLRNNLQKGIKHLSKYEKMGKVSPKVFQRYMQLYAKQMGKVGRAGAKIAVKPLGRVAIKGGMAFLGGVVFVLGLIPLWTISVLLCLREQ